MLLHKREISRINLTVVSPLLCLIWQSMIQLKVKTCLRLTVLLQKAINQELETVCCGKAQLKVLEESTCLFGGDASYSVFPRVTFKKKKEKRKS